MTETHSGDPTLVVWQRGEFWRWRFRGEGVDVLSHQEFVDESSACHDAETSYPGVARVIGEPEHVTAEPAVLRRRAFAALLVVLARFVPVIRWLIGRKSR